MNWNSKVKGTTRRQATLKTCRTCWRPVRVLLMAGACCRNACFLEHCGRHVWGSYASQLLRLAHWFLYLILIVCALKFVLKPQNQKWKNCQYPTCVLYFPTDSHVVSHLWLHGKYGQDAELPITVGGGKEVFCLFVCLWDEIFPILVDS